MDEKQFTDALESLREGEIHEYRVKKEVFLDFRKVLINHLDFKNFRGNAQVGGDVIYTYELEWTK